MGIKIKINGIESLNRKIDRLIEHDIKDAVTKATSLVFTEAKLTVPVDQGNLRKSLHMEVEDKEKETVGKVATNMEYAPYVEFGTGRRGTGSYPYEIEGVQLSYNQKYAGQTAQPYLYPSLENNRDECRMIIERAIQKKIQQIK